MQGEFRSLVRATVYPKPVSAPPIWIGGNSEVAIRRAARLGDAWVPAALTVDEVAAGRAVLEDASRRRGRDPATLGIGISLTVELARPGAAAAAQSVHTHPSTKRVAGTLAHVADRLRAYATAGVGEFLLSFSARTLEETLDHMSVFAEHLGLPVHARRS